MKKLLSIAAMAALLSTNGMAVDVNKINIKGVVEAGAQVSFGASPTGTLTAGTFEFEGADLDLGNMALDSDTQSLQDIYVNTNSNNGVKMTVTPAVGEDLNGGLKDASGNIVPVTYTYMTASLTNEGVLCTAPNDGTAKVGTFLAVAHPAANQISGNYDTVLDVVIAAN